MSVSNSSRRSLLIGSFATGVAALASRADASRIKPTADVLKSMPAQPGADQAQKKIEDRTKTDFLKANLILGCEYLNIAKAIVSKGDTSRQAAVIMGGNKPEATEIFFTACMSFQACLKTMMLNGVDAYEIGNLTDWLHDLKTLRDALQGTDVPPDRVYSGRNYNLAANTPDNAALLIEGLMIYLGETGIAPWMLSLKDPMEADFQIRERIETLYSGTDKAIHSIQPIIAAISDKILKLQPPIDAALAVGLNSDLTIQPILFQASNVISGLRRKAQQTLQGFPAGPVSSAALPTPAQ